MVVDPRSDLEAIAADILDEVPETAAGPTPFVFHRLGTAAAPRTAAVDGGCTVVLDVKTSGIYYVRAGYVLRQPGDQFQDRVGKAAPRMVTRRRLNAHWGSVCAEYGWGIEVSLPHVDNDRIVPQLAEAERVLAEYNSCRRALHELHAGDLLLVDGSFEEDERLAPLRESLIDRARDRDVHLVGVSKDSSLSLGGILPFTLELEEMAEKRRVAAPWWVDVTEQLGRGDGPVRTLCVRLDSRSPAYRVDVALGEPGRVAAWLLDLANDPVFPGYPYPLARIHERVAYTSGEAIDLRRELEAIVARTRGFRLSLRLFGRGRDVLTLAN